MHHVTSKLGLLTAVLLCLAFVTPICADEAPRASRSKADLTPQGKQLARLLSELTKELDKPPSEGMTEDEIMELIHAQKRADRSPAGVLALLLQHARLWQSARTVLWRAFDRTTDQGVKRRALQVLVHDTQKASRRRVAAELTAHPRMFTTRSLLVLSESGSESARTRLARRVRATDPAKILGGATTSENLTLILVGLHLAQHSDDAGRKALEWGRRATAPGAYPWDLAAAYGLTLLGEKAAYPNAREGCLRVITRLLGDGNIKDARQIAVHVLFFDHGVNGKTKIVPTRITEDAGEFVAEKGIGLSSVEAILAALGPK